MSKQISRRPTKQARRQDRREELARREAERQRAARTRLTAMIISIIVAVVLIASVVTYFVFFNGKSQAQTEQVFNQAYPPIDNVYCDQLEQTAVHYHAHVSIYINGQPVAIAQGVGIATDNSCFYWLHTHDNKGIIHIESPADKTFTIGNFFDEWGTQFPQLGYPSQLDLNGWQAYVNGQPYTGDFHKIVLKSHELITLAYNSPGVKPDTVYDWNAAGLQQ